VTEPIASHDGPSRFRLLTILALLAVSVAGSVMFVWAYWESWSRGWIGGFLALSLLTLGAALVVVAHRVLPGGTYVEPRELMPSPRQEQLAFGLDFGRAGTLRRRRFLWIAVGGAFAAAAGAALAPIRSLGKRPNRHPAHTAWQTGVRVVNGDGVPVRLADLPVGGMLTVFPEGQVDTEAAEDAQTVVVRVGRGVAAGAPTHPSVADVYAYSKVCTHMGCPVGQYMADTHELMCPCHQTIFSVLDGGIPTFGPAGRALPQLPLAVDADGILVADGDFSGPVGPSFWTMR
jgi:ubiquinol-cytochrome c reductase iron-sulfur subunit